MIPWLRGDAPFPPLAKALKSPNGLICAGWDLSPERIVDAYGHGIFPWFSEGDPILWWSPDPRMVLFPDELRVSRSLRRTVARGAYETRFDTAFRDVIEACAAPRDGQGGTWIVPEMVHAYTRLHELGFVHSVESWLDGELAGGLYGIALGALFAGESMYHRETGASKVAFASCADRLRSRGFRVFDVQVLTSHLEMLGCVEISRAEYRQRAADCLDIPARFL